MITTTSLIILIFISQTFVTSGNASERNTKYDIIHVESTERNVFSADSQSINATAKYFSPLLVGLIIMLSFTGFLSTIKLMIVFTMVILFIKAKKFKKSGKMATFLLGTLLLTVALMLPAIL